VILSEYPRDVLEELPFTYNYPLHLYESAPSHRKPQKLGELTTIRFEDSKDLDLITKIDPYADWLQKIKT
jgi:hypothetical protein